MNCSQNRDQAACLLLDDLEEQFESVPIMMLDTSDWEEMNSARKLTHSRKSSSLPAVGEYRDIARIVQLVAGLNLTAENLSCVTGSGVTNDWRSLCQASAAPCQV